MFRSEVRMFLCIVVTLIGFESGLRAADWTVVKADNLSEWSDPGKWWRVENGVFIADSKGGKSLPKIHYLEWKGSTGKDFELSLEYRITAKSPQDAGVNFRVERPHAQNLKTLPSYQAELDTCNLYSRQRFIRDGKLYGHIHDGKRTHMFKRNLVSTGHPGGRITTKPLKEKFVPGQAFHQPPEWNRCRIVAVGEHVQLFLNGALANEIYDRDPKNRSTGDGIALQYRPNGGYRYEVRDLKFRPTTSNPALPAQNTHGSEELDHEILNLNELNTAGNEFYPWLSKDGLTIYWTGTEANRERWIWTASRVDAKSVFRNQRRLFKGDSPVVSVDGRELIYNDPRKTGFLVATRESATGEFHRSRAVGELKFREGEDPAPRALAADGMTLFLDKRPAPKQPWAIWVSKRENTASKWTQPEPIHIASTISQGVRFVQPFPLNNDLDLLVASQANNRDADVKLGMLSRPAADQPFDSFREIPLRDGHGVLTGSFTPRYIKSTRQLFFSSWAAHRSEKAKKARRSDIWVIENFSLPTQR